MNRTSPTTQLPEATGIQPGDVPSGQPVNRALPTTHRRSLRMRFLILRARFSIPALLGSADERRVISMVAAVNGAAAIMTISVVAWLCDLPLVFPALGPTAFILFSSPFAPSAAPRAVVLGHLIGISSGCAAWHSLNYACDGNVTLQDNVLYLSCSASLALAMTSLLLIRLSCPHAPACASALIVALGGVTDWTDLLLMAAAVILVTAQSVGINRLASLPVPIWSSGYDDT